MPEPTAITVGSFDGVHLGHASLIRAARESVGATGRVIAIAFSPHPLSLLRPVAEPARLTTWTQRQQLLLSAGADEVVRLEPTRDLLALEPRAFVERIAREHSPAVWAEGPDFRFGKARAGDTRTLETLGGLFGFRAIVVPQAEVALTDLTLAPASSTLVRWLLSHGRVGDARRVLGRAYDIVGVVEPGDQRGRAIGFPTANITTECAMPADGVYAGVATLPDGRYLAAAISVGTKPTFGERPRTLEAHILDAGDPWDGRGADRQPLGYGWTIRLRFATWLREQLRYDRLDDLIEQIEADATRATEYFNSRRADYIAPAGAAR